ncbi:hypothetical protein FK535_00080 [Mycolicibacterium sp. 018/SC-01/001]|nr:hypothetical protein FK535_00080 [Mycolicibacterium sp. 018/SC-01/001]
MPLIIAGPRRFTLAAIAACAAAPLLFSAAASAQPAPPPVDPRAGCESPDFGGLFVAVTATHAECRYIVSGSFYWDNYDDGVYTGTLVYRDGAKVPTERPQIPEQFTMPGGGPPPVIPFQVAP